MINSGKTKDFAEANELTRGLTKTRALVETLASVTFLVLALLISVVLWYIFFCLFHSLHCSQKCMLSAWDRGAVCLWLSGTHVAYFILGI